MSDNTARPLTSGGDTIRSDDVQDLSTGTALDVKHQVFKIGLGAMDIDGGLASPANPFPAAGGLFAEVSSKLATVVDLLTARALQRARAKGAAQPPPRPIGGASASAFNPLSITGCAVWYDLTHCTTAAGKVTALPDQSGNARNATLSGAGLAFTAANAGYNNRPTLNRSDATDLIQSPDMGITTGPFTVVFVGDEVAGMPFTFLMRSGAPNLVDLRSQTGIYRGSEDGGATELDGAGTPTSPGVAIVVFNGASSRIYSTALTAVSGDTGAQPDMTGVGMFVGADSTASGSGDLNFTHALIYSGALSDANCKYLLNGFGAQAGITIGP